MTSPDTEDHAAASGADQRRAQGFSHCYRLRQKRRDQLNQSTMGHGGGVEVDCKRRQAEQMCAAQRRLLAAEAVLKTDKQLRYMQQSHFLIRFE